MVRKRKPAHTPEESAHLNRVAKLGCLICGSLAEIHHVRTGQGGSQRATHFQVLPLCPRHHRLGAMGEAFHAGPRFWQAIHGTETALLLKVEAKLRGAA